MNSPFHNIDLALEPFFDEPLIFTHKHGDKIFTQTITCSVFTSNTTDPLSETTMDTNRDEISIMVPRKCWELLKDFKRGDTIERCGLFKKKFYKITDVMDDDVMESFVIMAQSTKKK